MRSSLATKPATALSSEPAPKIVGSGGRNSQTISETPTAPQVGQLADPLKVLEARAEARARLWASCDILDLLDAVDPLQAYAERSGLVDRMGQDAVQAIIADAFAPFIAANKSWLESAC
jgi:hypothetical protein